ncbi:MAG: ribbon-helix-helix domain-containing protein [Oligoflexia bacterium]|nr:ribbon-helix-helix domain-containing protein [Bdellovibrionales bacterium]MYE07673.1 ribbon-helix-helix domain-containing protein [Oligoflexia bacterium]
MKTKRKITTTIYLTEEQQSLLKELSQRSKVPVAEYIRQGVDLILKKHARHLPGQLSFILDKNNTERDRNKK